MIVETRKVTRDIITTIEKDEIVYIAKDNKIFENEIDCRFYEYKCLDIPIKYNFKFITIKDYTHFKCTTEDSFRNALLYFTKTNYCSKLLLHLYWNQFKEFTNDWFYIDVDESGDLPSYCLERSLDRLGELKEYVQEYSELQDIFLKEM